MGVDKDITINQSIADMFQLLSISLHLPSMDYIKGLGDGSVAKDILDILTELAYPTTQIEEIRRSLDYIRESAVETEKCFSATRQEYTRLFADPQKPVIGIYETTFLFDEETDKKPSMFISPAALSAERYYKMAGLQTKGPSQEPSDFFPTELEFMMFLYQQLVGAFQANHVKNQEKWETLITEFSDTHLKKWAGRFFSECQTESNHPIYKAIGILGKMVMDRTVY